MTELLLATPTEARANGSGTCTTQRLTRRRTAYVLSEACSEACGACATMAIVQTTVLVCSGVSLLCKTVVLTVKVKSLRLKVSDADNDYYEPMKADVLTQTVLEETVGVQSRRELCDAGSPRWL
ncbi:hypothetical protein IWW41_004739, partial [Coemansia sp. RSA 2522]